MKTASLRNDRAQTTFGMLPTDVAMPAWIYYPGNDEPIRKHLFIRPRLLGQWRVDMLALRGLEGFGLIVEAVRTWAPGTFGADGALLAGAFESHLAFQVDKRLLADTISSNVLGGELAHDGEWPLGAARLTLTIERMLVVTVAHRQNQPIPMPSVAVVCTEIERSDP